MPAVSPEKLPAYLEKGVQSFYLIHGEEDILRVRATDAVRAAAAAAGCENREAYTVSSGFDWSELAAAVQSPGLFSEKKLLEIHIPGGKPGKEGGSRLQALAEIQDADICMVLILPKLDKAQLKTDWFTAWAGRSVVVEAKAVGLQGLTTWIRAELARYRLEIEADALAWFAEQVEGNLSAAVQEVEKLSLLQPAGTCLTADDIQSAVADVARFDVFQPAAAWMAGDVLRLQRLLDGLDTEGSEAVLMVWTLEEDVRALLKLLAAVKSGADVSRLYGSLRLWGDKQKWALPAARRLGVAKLLAALQECARADRQIKGAEEGVAADTIRQLMLSLAA